MNRTRIRHATRIPALAALCALAAAPAAAAQGPGGAEIPGPPKVAGISCAGQPQGRCGRGQLMTITGKSLQSVNRIEFLGGKSKRDDVRVKVSARAARSGELVVAVPRKARSGPVRLRSSVGESALIPALDLVAGTPSTEEGGQGGRIFAGGRQVAELT